MRRMILILILALMINCDACGPVFILAPPERDLTNCLRIPKQFRSTLRATTVPIPFSGATTIRMFTSKPDLWSEFNGTIHLVQVDWDVTWISKVYVSIGGLTVAVYEDGSWSAVGENLDLTPHLKDDGRGSLYIDTRFRGKGVRPGQRTTIHTSVELAVCGENADLVFAELIDGAQGAEEL